ncbi:MAG: hypothetical protein ISN29_12785 [Gammaproteobacteria bacterium AqS3]|nr:hypothetical protein [Gammaproteobacteria bacterium AqS3]
MHDDREKIEGISPDCQARDAKRLSSIRFCGAAFDFKDADSKAPAPRSHHRPRSPSTPKPVNPEARHRSSRMRSGSDIRPKKAPRIDSQGMHGAGIQGSRRRGIDPAAASALPCPNFEGIIERLGQCPLPAGRGERGYRPSVRRSSSSVAYFPLDAFGIGLIDTRLIDTLPICGISNADRRIDRSPGSFCGPFIFRFEDEYPS